MGTCDVCNATTSWEQGTTYTATEFRQLVSKGFEPDESTIRMMTIYGISRQQAIAQWKLGLVAQSATDWLLCPSCASRAARYMPKKAGAVSSVHIPGYRPSTPSKPHVRDLGLAILGLVLTFLLPVLAGILCIRVALKAENKAAKVLGWVGFSLNVLALLSILVVIITRSI